MGRPKGIFVGQKFGYLLVVRVENGSAGHHAVAVCTCVCGKEHRAKSHLLKRGSISSCGCRKSENIRKALEGRGVDTYHRLDWGIASFNALFGAYKKSALRRRRIFQLSKEDFRLITSSNCFYCGQEPTKIVSSHERLYFGAYPHNGVDRIDNELGYLLENSRPCCWICNNAKKSLTEEKFFEWIDRLCEWRNNEQGT